MAIDDKDIKLLWGKAAGRCSYPGCYDDLAPLLLQSGTTVLGEMAHIIGRKSGAARSSAAIGTDDTYLNLLLLCPPHHTLIDKAEKDFPIELLKKWKADWEGHVAALFLKIADRGQLIREISTRLAENHQIHAEWGPTSVRAKESPQTLCLFERDRPIFVDVKPPHQVLALGLWDLVADQSSSRLGARLPVS